MINLVKKKHLEWPVKDNIKPQRIMLFNQYPYNLNNGTESKQKNNNKNLKITNSLIKMEPSPGP